MVVIRVEKLIPEAEIPKKATDGSIALDVKAFAFPEGFDDGAFYQLMPGHRAIFGTGLKVSIPEGYVMDIRPRSGHAAKNGVIVLNAPGTIDPDYRGEVGVILINLGTKIFTIERGMKIAQIIVHKVEDITFVEGSVGETKRGSGGFGSTGDS